MRHFFNNFPAKFRYHVSCNYESSSSALNLVNFSALLFSTHTKSVLSRFFIREFCQIHMSSRGSKFRYSICVNFVFNTSKFHYSICVQKSQICRCFTHVGLASNSAQFILQQRILLLLHTSSSVRRTQDDILECRL